MKKKEKVVLTQHQLGNKYLELKSAERCVLPREECAEADPAQVGRAHLLGKQSAVSTGPKASCAGLGRPPGMQDQLSLPPSLPPSLPLPRLLLLGSTLVQNSSLLKYQAGPFPATLAVIRSGGMHQ